MIPHADKIQEIVNSKDNIAWAIAMSIANGNESIAFDLYKKFRTSSVGIVSFNKSKSCAFAAAFFGFIFNANLYVAIASSFLRNSFKHCALETSTLAFCGCICNIALYAFNAESYFFWS